MAEPTLYLMVGYPGAGKTTVAKAVAKQTGAVHIWADVERHKLFPNPSHQTTESLALYKVLNQRAEQLLEGGQSVVFDTGFNHKSDRVKLRQMAAKVGAKTRVIWVDTPISVAKKRAVNAPVSRNGYSVSMSEALFNQHVAKLESPAGEDGLVKIDGARLNPKLIRLS